MDITKVNPSDICSVEDDGDVTLWGPSGDRYVVQRTGNLDERQAHADRIAALVLAWLEEAS